MFNSLYHAEIGGGYTLRRKIIINAADLRPLGGQIDVAALIENGDELNSTTVKTEADALAASVLREPDVRKWFHGEEPIPLQEICSTDYGDYERLRREALALLSR